MSKKKIVVTMGKGVVAKAPYVISSLGLDSCVAVTLYDTKKRIGGLAHIMMPNSLSVKEGIPLIGKDIGGKHGRSIEFHLDSGSLEVEAIGKKTKRFRTHRRYAKNAKFFQIFYTTLVPLL